MGLEKFGITNFYNENVYTSNSYTLKKRYEDFVVKEINDGVMCDDSSIVSQYELQKGIRYLLWLYNNYTNCLNDPDDHETVNLSLSADISITDNIISHKSKNVDFDNYDVKDIIEILTIKNLNKENRTTVHQKIKMHPLLFTKTNADSSISILYGYKKLRYKFTLKKMNRDSMSACQYIAKSLNVPYGNIKYSGNKDKRALTYQNVSIDCYFKDLFDLALKFQEDKQKIFILNIRQCSGHLKLGELEANRFTITIRPTNKKADLNLNFKNLENGFYNYYGQQRFGMAGNNHIVGKYLLEKNYKGALETIMQPCDKDNERIKNIKKIFLEGSFGVEINEKDLKRTLEGKILYNRIKQNDDKVVFKHLQNELTKLYFHSYQSYNFNCLVNEADGEYIEQVQEDSKHLKGNKRKVIEKARDVEFKLFDGRAVVSFTLNPGVFATMALREVIGDDVYHTE